MSVVNFKTVFSSNGNVVQDIKNKYGHIRVLLDIFSMEIEDIKVSVDVKFNNSNFLEVNPDTLRKIAIEKGFIQNKNKEGSFRRFHIQNKYTLTQNIELYSCKDKMVNTYISVNIDNIIVDFETLYDQLITTAYFYMVQYCKLHYNYMKAVDEKYVKNNEKFYNKLQKLSD